MNDWLNPEPQTQAPDDGGYLAPSTDDLLWGSDTATATDQAPADPYQTTIGSYHDTPPAPAAQPAFDPAAGSFSVQAPMLEDLRPSIATVGGAREDLSNIVLDVEVPVEVCFGNAALTVEEFLEMGPGSVVELDRAISEPIELRVRGRLIATGQLVSINGSYGLRITDTVEGHTEGAR